MSNVVKLEQARSARMSESEKTEELLSDGYTRIPDAMLERMGEMNLTQLEFRALCIIIRKTLGFNKTQDWISMSQLADAMSSPEQTISEKKASEARKGLLARRVVILESTSQSPVRVNNNAGEWQHKTKATKQPQRKNPRNCKNDEKNGDIPRNTGKNNPRNPAPTIDRIDITNTPSEYLPEPADETGQVADQNLPPESTDGELPEPPPKKPKADKHPVPFNDIVALYHEILPDAPEFVVWNSTREGQIRARWNQKLGSNKTPCNTLDFWRRFFGYVAKSDFLCGRVDPKPGRKLFVADLEWLTKAGNFAKIIEGRYHEDGEGKA